MFKSLTSEDMKYLFELKKELIPYTDALGAVVQRDMDGGDSLNRSAELYILYWFAGFKLAASSQWFLVKNNFFDGRGLWRRHWDGMKWYSNPNNLSRDQWKKAFLAMLIARDYKIIFLSLLRRVLRLGFHQNIHRGTDCDGLKCYKIPDLIGIDEIGMLLRGLPFMCLAGFLLKFGWFGPLYYYGALCLVDCAFLADLYFRKKQTWDYDALMASTLMFAVAKVPTPISILAARLYLKTDFEQRIIFNFSRTENDIAPLGRFYAKTVREFLTMNT